MTIGELSHRTGVPIKTLREYTDTGLIYTVGRSPANYRLYDADALWCVHWIGELRGLGLTVAEIRASTRECLGRADRSVGPHLAELLHRSRERARWRITEQQQILARIDAFEADHRADLARAGDLRWAGDPRAGTAGEPPA
ncbi:MerR family transcriptional regulator (plasmid) [Streptomyces longwoodensis]|uniref:MerR family transcriptional regulator n=2 Tax=Streptomyces TaxID=1883 RepID=UPI002F9139A0|nr:MerR family transcriptional regulator [Streptomyces longwoodensis]